ncbi:MAG: 16S rRNA (adenine(1518)-N(6)/adenine(1519)-N(6))-dimethyltransferase RsmA [Propionibacteriaceae bacterium]|jgi:16S rRNA (adenine1518-N6/adenine1519-N6)-dimethyltransferase|nr:16S rRNA (adenine(1518)-N(6)/adenine(1519)-N(6))-dimethyltransferase RsmA [Propionibacteriaceae bacterium]
MALLDPRTIRALAAEIGLRPSKQRGQNFVHDANTLRRLVALAEVKPADAVLEIGPGLGSLTLALLEAGADVTAVEIEPALAELLPRTVADRLPERAEGLRVITADALEIRTLPDPQPTKLVANLPYNVAVPVLLHALTAFPTIVSGLIMVQLEVAERLVATPGSKVYGIPSAKLAWFAVARKVGLVPANVFWPVPNVASALVAFERVAPPPTKASRTQVFSLIDAAFAQRRKMLRGALSSWYGSASAAATSLQQAGIAPTARGETLSITDFARLADYSFPQNNPSTEHHI